MKVSVLAVTTAAAVLLLASTPTEGNGDVLKQWIDAAKGNSFYPTADPGAASAYDEETPVKGNKDIIFITQTKEITAGVNTKGTNLVAYHDKTSFQIHPQLMTPTNYLTWGENKATVLLLNGRRGDFFFTAALTGCEVWVADHKDYDPLVIHINARGVEDPVDKLKHMQNMAYEALDYFNQHIQQQESKHYHFVQRICYDYAQNDDVKFDDDDMKNYKNEFGKKNIPVGYYANENGFFYGFHSSDSWWFTLKSLKTGDLLVKTRCKEEDSLCIIL